MRDCACGPDVIRSTVGVLGEVKSQPVNSQGGMVIRTSLVMTRNLGKQRENCGENARAEAEAEEEGQRSTLAKSTINHYRLLIHHHRT